MVERARAIASRERDAALGARRGVPADVTPASPSRRRSGGLVDQHFGHAREFLVYDVSRDGARGSWAAAPSSSTASAARARTTCSPASLRALADCHAVLVAKVGRCPRGSARRGGHRAGDTGQAFRPIEAALLDWLAGRVARAARGEAPPLAPRRAPADPAPAEAARVA